MKLTKKNIILTITIIAAILIAIILYFAINIKKENNQLDSIMKEITTTYNLLETNIETYNNNRNDLSNLLNNYYSDKLDDDYDKYINILNKQETTIKQINANVLDLNDKCRDRLFSESNVNKICNNYKDYYETVVNVYINDEKQINDLIKNYNDNIDNSLEEYHSKDYNDYIDYNDDNKYLGRE